MGRRKIEIKMVDDSSARQVTFSKRRNGVFKKANEIATLCGAEVAVVVFSPGGKPFSFGNPDVDVVANRFEKYFKEEAKAEASTTKTKAIEEADEEEEEEQEEDDNVADTSQRQARVERLNRQLNDLVRKFDGEKKRGEKVTKALKEVATRMPSISELSHRELMERKAAMLKLQEMVKTHALDMEASSSLLMLSKPM